MNVLNAGPRYRKALLLTFATALLPTGLATMGTGSALAALGPCRSDPVVVLSNLKVMDISATIGDSQSDLNSVTYALSLPKGVRPLLVVPTDGLVGQVEHFSWSSNQPVNQYSVQTYVSTGQTVPVTASVLGVFTKSANATGTSNEVLTING